MQEPTILRKYFQKYIEYKSNNNTTKKATPKRVPSSLEGRHQRQIHPDGQQLLSTMHTRQAYVPDSQPMPVRLNIVRVGLPKACPTSVSQAGVRRLLDRPRAAIVPLSRLETTINVYTQILKVVLAL